MRFAARRCENSDMTQATYCFLGYYPSIPPVKYVSKKLACVRGKSEGKSESDHSAAPFRRAAKVMQYSYSNLSKKARRRGCASYYWTARREKRRDSLRPCHCCHYMSMSVRRGHGSWSSVTVAGTDEPTDDARGEAMPPFQTIRFAR